MNLQKLAIILDFIFEEIYKMKLQQNFKKFTNSKKRNFRKFLK